MIFSPVLLLAAVAAAGSLKLDDSAIDVVNRTATVVAGEVRLSAAPGSGLAWIKGLEMNEGCLEVDVKGSNEFGRSFVGLAFRAADADTYDTVYVRPFVFQSDNPEF